MRKASATDTSRARNRVYGFQSHDLFEKEFELAENELEQLTAEEVAARLNWNEQARKTFVKDEMDNF